jgi:hypothetical protein
MDDLARTKSIPRGIPKEKVPENLLDAIPNCSFDELLPSDFEVENFRDNTVGLCLRHASSTWPRLTILSYDLLLRVESFLSTV